MSSYLCFVRFWVEPQVSLYSVLWWGWQARLWVLHLCFNKTSSTLSVLYVSPVCKSSLSFGLKFVIPWFCGCMTCGFLNFWKPKHIQKTFSFLKSSWNLRICKDSSMCAERLFLALGPLYVLLLTSKLSLPVRNCWAKHLLPMRSQHVPLLFRASEQIPTEIRN